MSSPYRRGLSFFAVLPCLPQARRGAFAVLLAGAALAPVAARASGGAAAIQGALQAGDADALTLTWTRGRPDAVHTELRIAAGKAVLRRCTAGGAGASCTEVGTSQALSGGQKEQLLSGLRAAGFATLRTSDADAVALADRGLEVAVRGAPAGTWQLPRGEWPAPPDGYGAAEFLDDLGTRIEQAASARQPVAVPRTLDELQRVRVQLRLSPRRSPGGVVVVERGTAQVTPEEGSLPRVPRPRPFSRALTPGEQAELLAALQAAGLETLDTQVPRRAQPAVDDADGRVATLHLLPLDGEADKGAPLPRGCERYLADFQRSPAAPLLNQLVGWVTSPPPATGKAASK